MAYFWFIALPMMACTFWAVFFFIRSFSKSAEPRVQRTILLFFIAAMVVYTDHWMFLSNVRTPAAVWTYLTADLCVYPIYFMYLCALTRTKSFWEIACMLIPAAVMVVLIPLNMYFRWTAMENLILGTRICFGIQVIWVWIHGVLLLRKTLRRLNDTYSDDRSRALNPIRVIQQLLGLTATASMLLNAIGPEFFSENAIIYIPASLMSVLLFSIGYVAAHTTIPQETVAEEVPAPLNAVSEEQLSALMQKIDRLMREKKLYANANLTIQDLASAANSNRTYVSNAINRHTGYSFSLYVARYRVEHAQTILRNGKYASDHDAIADAIALSGFSSDQTFYRVFKELTGTTPLRFRSQNAPTP